MVISVGAITTKGLGTMLCEDVSATEYILNETDKICTHATFIHSFVYVGIVMAVICAVVNIGNELFCLLGSLSSFFIFHYASKECKVFIEQA